MGDDPGFPSSQDTECSERERRLHDFAAASSEWFWETNAEGRFVWFSPEAEERIGRPVTEMLGKTRYDLAHDYVSLEKWRQHLEDLRQHRPFRDFCFKMVLPGGREVYLQTSGVPFFDTQGEFLGHRGSGRNITAKVEADRRLQEAEERLRVAFQTSAAAVAISRVKDGLFLEVNDAMQRLVGLCRDEIVGRTSLELGFWESEDFRNTWVSRLISEKSIRDFEMPLRHVSGEICWVSVSATLFCVRDEYHIIAYFADNTATKFNQREILKLTKAVEQSSAAIIITDNKGYIEYVNPSFTQITGYTMAEIKGGTPRILKSGLNANSEYQRLWSTIRSGENFRGEFRNRRKDGSLYWANILISPVKEFDKTITHFIGIQHDITDRKLFEEKLRSSEERYRSLIESALLGICILQDGDPVFVNQSFADIFGYESPSEVMNSRSSALLEKGIADLALPDPGCVSSTSLQPPTSELTGNRKDGSKVHLLAQLRKIPWNGGTALQASVIDISRRKQMEARLQFQASFDALTGLPNRSLALDRLTTAIRNARNRPSNVGILYIDFDHFKNINDTFGHSAGDSFLCQAAKRVTTATREVDTVARLGGDEFVAILENIRSLEEATRVATRIVEQMAAPFELCGHEVFVGASVGVALYPEHGRDAETLLQHADAAMYVAKSEGRGSVRLFTSALSERRESRLRLEAELRRSLEREQLSILYQPLVDVASGAVVGAEALLRWHHPQLGEISPDIFIPIAEEAGIIVDIGDWVLNRSCADARQWIQNGHDAVRLSVNVSSRQFRGAGLIATIRRVLENSSLAPENLELEITESLLIENVEETVATLRRLEAFGVCVAVDDFGTGYSSLNYLTRFPLDTLKIDRSFIIEMLEDRTQATLVDALIMMAHRLDLRVVAEGVENLAQLQFLAARHCDAAQGYYFSRPLPLPEFLSLLAHEEQAWEWGLDAQIDNSASLGLGI